MAPFSRSFGRIDADFSLHEYQCNGHDFQPRTDESARLRSDIATRSVVIDLSVPGVKIDRWVKVVSGLAPCQCRVPAGMKATSPGSSGMAFVIGGDEPAARRGDQHLVRRVAVRAVDRSVLERHRGHPQQIPKRVVDDFLSGNRTDEDRIRGRRALRTVETHVSNAGHTCSPFWFMHRNGRALAPSGKYAGHEAATHDSQSPSGRRRPRRPRRRRRSGSRRFPVTSGFAAIARRMTACGRGRALRSASYTRGRLCRRRLETTRHGDRFAHASSTKREEGTVRMADQQYSPRDGQAFDVVLIGGGTGGYVAAIRAAQLGLDVASSRSTSLGGTCLHRGCIPTKAFLKSADVYEEVQHAAEFGVDIAGEDRLQLPRGAGSVEQSRQRPVQGSAVSLRQEVQDPGHRRVRQHRRSRPGPGRPDDGGAPFTLATRNIIIDTGTRPRAIKDLPFDGKRVINSDDAVVLETLPQSFIIRGGGAVGVEWASIYGRYGSKVSLVGRVVPAEDEEAAAVLIRAFKRQGIDVFPTSRPTADDIDVTKSGVRMRVKDDRGKEEVVEAEVLLVAIGRQGNVEDIGLEKVGVKTEDGLIPVDAMMRTNVPNIYAIGDVNGQQMLAHTAMHMGVIAIEHIAGHNPYPLDVLNSPMVTFCRPEIASVGLTEKQAIEQGRTVKTGKFPMRPNGKAVIEGRDRWLRQDRRRRRDQRHARHDDRRSARDGADRRSGDGPAAGSHAGGDRDQRLPAPDRLRGHPRGRARSARPRAPYLDSSPGVSSRERVWLQARPPWRASPRSSMSVDVARAEPA